MTPALHVRQAGPLCTIQDAGRTGLMRYGVTPAGPMDWLAHRLANRLAGNAPDAGAVEIGPGGLEIAVVGAAARLAVVAHGFAVALDGRPIPASAAVTLLPGAILDIRPGASHVWAYLSVAGGFALAPVMGSLSTHLRSAIGPLGGRALTAGTLIPLNAVGRRIDLPDIEYRIETGPIEQPIRFVPGPQDDYFSPATFSAFCAVAFQVSSHSDRMAYRLTGPILHHVKGHDIVSDGIAWGAIQVPGDGQPIVLMADRQPTGGYPKIGTVIRADLPRLAQCRAGNTVRFRAVSIDQAMQALRARLALIDELGTSTRPLQFHRQ